MYDERRRFDRDFKQEVQYIFGDDLYQTQIRTSIRIVEAGKVEDVLNSPQDAYTKALLADTPTMESALAAAAAG